MSSMRCWCPPDPVAFTAEDVARALAAGAARSPSAAFFDRPAGELVGADGLVTLSRLQSAAEAVAPVPVGFVSFAAVLEYPAGGGGLPWHRDRLDDDRPGVPGELEEAAERVLSCTVQLSGPDDYQGGALQARDGDGTTTTAPRDLGTVAFFPSTVRHRVTPVTAGRRLGLVAFWTAA